MIVRAEAGAGKSALAAHLAATRSWPCHFTQLPDGDRPAAARLNLAAQLIEQWDLQEERAPGGVLPDGWTRPGWFAGLLEAAAVRARGRKPAQPVVLVVDGLDEASAERPGDASGGLPLGLPASLPDGVFVVVTSRLGSDRWLHAVRNPARWLEIKVESPGNLSDMRRFIDKVASPDGGDGRLIEAVRASGADLGWFRREVAAACAGVWIYLRCVLSEITNGTRDPRSVADLPADLAAYYAQHVQQWRGHLDEPAAQRRWERTRLPLLAILAAVRVPLTVTGLARLAQVPAGEAAQRFIEETARAFLSRDDDGTPAAPRYALRHQSLRDLLTGNIPPERPDLEDLARVFTAQSRLAGEQLRAALEALSDLPPEQAEVTMLRMFAGLDTAVTAQVLGKPQADVLAAERSGLKTLENKLPIPRDTATRSD